MYPDGGGISAIVENCVQALDGAYEVHVAIVEDRSGRRGRLQIADDRVHTLGHRNLLKPMVMPTSILYSLRVGRFFHSLVTSLQPAALLVQDAMFLSVPGVLATRGTATRLAIMDHGTLSNMLDRDWQRMFVRRFRGVKRALFQLGFRLDSPWRAARWRIGLRSTDAAWYVGEELRPWFARAGGRAASYAQIVPSDFRAPTDRQRAEARAALGVETPDTVVNMVTRLDGEKGLADVLDAVATLKHEGIDFRLLVAGHGSLEDWFRAESAARGLGRVVTFLGFLGRDELTRLHDASDFHLYAGTIGCGVSIALLEAMVSGVVPVVSDVPSAHRSLVGDAGWVFPAGDSEQLTSSLRAAVRSRDGHRRYMSELAQKRVADYTTPSLKDLVDELVSSS